MTVYAESSAVLAWLLGQREGPAVVTTLGTGAVTTSELTLVECDRAFRRYVVTGELTDEKAYGLRTKLASVTVAWHVESVTASILARAGGQFPDDAIRTLDAIHLATAAVLQGAGIEIEMLSLDERIRSNAGRLGFRVRPD